MGRPEQWVGGLSPPTRGSLADATDIRGERGSIPAHTGKPEPGSRAAGEAGVYPRPHGEASIVARRFDWRGGLSPPTRGSHRGDNPQGISQGSIPAHTGKPFRSSGFIA